MKKIIAISVVTSLVLGNSLSSVNAINWSFKHQLTKTSKELTHKPFWLFEDESDYDNNYQGFTVDRNECVE